MPDDDDVADVVLYIRCRPELRDAVRAYAERRRVNQNAGAIMLLTDALQAEERRADARRRYAARKAQS
ncbi:hypothetical protein H7X46_11325 [Pseudonocardia sp. C8]|uniref:hypothetical protein n=1 Tax=Pseudonocardia sp. C8 TaxID=2762759 RepID=UPI00164275D6|nr:hypothetical protein [Pseudonocardia sp. C8]MBC3191651.1 hypothetical protein [Pseudonocardia sp. C8]